MAPANRSEPRLLLSKIINEDTVPKAAIKAKMFENPKTETSGWNLISVRKIWSSNVARPN